MKFSYSLPTPRQDAAATGFDLAVEAAHSAERLGFGAVSASDHPFPVMQSGSPGHQTHDPFVLLTTIAATTQSVALHFSLIVAPYRNPFVVARMLATLDVASKGRVIAGIGAGYLRAEFEALGAPFAQRSEFTRSAVEAMKLAWTESVVENSTPWWHASGNSMRPGPVTRPHPPMWRGGNGRIAEAEAIVAYQGWTPFEVAAERAESTRTQEMSVGSLAGRMTTLRAKLERADSLAPFDVCFVRSGPGRTWLSDGIRAAEELAELERMGVTWVEFDTAGETPAQIEDELSRVVDIARGVGVWQSTPADAASD